MLVETSVVGSFPKLDTSLEQAIMKVVNLQLEYGIDVITDGEQRGSMISYFEQLSGLEKAGDSLRIIGKVGPIDGELNEFHKIVDYKKVKAILASKSRDDIKIKITFTGPLTLGTICALTDTKSTEKIYDLADRRKLYFDFVAALLPLIIRALELGALVQIDEPLLSTGSIELGLTKEVLEDFFMKLPASFVSDERVSLHICGSIKNVPGLFDVLLGLPVLVLSLGFSGEKESENMDLISKKTFEKHYKKLGAGFISNTRVEDQKNIKDRYFEVEKRIGKENIKYLHPDCGFALVSPDKVKQILENMRIVSKLVI
jgi:5-methyltetrahydropteroyltriglutamate--homocysteine methyltransferase